MGFAPSRKAKMFNARNLNDLYARADRKVYLTLQGKSPLLADNWTLSHPAGVWYVFTSGSPKRLVPVDSLGDGTIYGIGNVYRLNHDQAAVPFELAKLDSVAIDYAGKQVFCDLWTYGTDPTPDADVMSVHYSFETHQRVINDVAYDVHLGLQPPDPWFTGGDPQSSWVRSTFAATNLPPYFPPGRSHRHERSVAEIACEGLNLFVIKKEWVRYDCWRIHNLSDFSLTLVLEFPNGLSSRQTIPPYECRTARRAANGLWMSVWAPSYPDLPTCYFWPYVTGDIPLFAGGPPQNWTETTNSGEALALERSQSANNLANPWIILEWMKSLGATMDPRVPFDIWPTYSEFYKDPKNDDNAIGDCVLTWGRARLARSGSNEWLIINIPSVNELIPTLRAVGVDCELSGTTLTLTNRSRWDRIYPLDCNLFTREYSTSNYPAVYCFWDIGANAGVTTWDVSFPGFYTKQPHNTPSLAWQYGGWNTATPPTIFNTIGALRRKVLVEAGWMLSETEFAEIPEAFAASLVTLTPLGLTMRVPTTTYVYNVALQVDGTYEYENGANGSAVGTQEGIYPRFMRAGLSRSLAFDDNYWAADETWLLQPPAYIPGPVAPYNSHLFPAVNATGFGFIPSIWTSYIPAGGPWGYSRTVYDFEIRRCFEITTDEDVFSNGADFWINKWGGPGGVDASVRIPGKPDVMPQYRYVSSDTTEGFERVATDDIWFDSTLPLRAGTTQQGQTANRMFDGVTLIHPLAGYDASVQPYSILPPYQLHQKVPKTAWLWDLLEWHVRAWRRIYRHVKGERDIPIAENRSMFNAFDAAGSGEEFGDYVIYLTFQGYSDLLANGVSCRSDGVNSASPYFVTIDNLAAFISRRGFSYLLDTIQYPASYPLGVLIPKRRYGPGETTENLGMYSIQYDWYRYANHRFIDLRFQGE
jgi:hypothetical protein